METKDLLERIEKLEAETYVLRANLRMLIGMLPATQEINGAIADTTRMLNTLPSTEGIPAVALIQATTTELNLLQVSRRGLLSGR